MRRRKLVSAFSAEVLEQRTLLSASPVRINNIGYFASENEPKIERFDVNTGTWMTPIVLQGATTGTSVLHVDADGIYSAAGNTVYRNNLDGTGRTSVVTASSSIQAIHADGNLLFVNETTGYYARFISVNKSTKVVIDQFENYVDSVYGSSIAPGVNRIIGRSEGISPSDITYVAYDDAGHFTNGGDSPYHGNYPGASRTWIAPTGDLVLDDAGMIYSTDALHYVASLGTRIKDVDFLGHDVPIALSGSVLTAYSQAFLPTGSVNLDHTPSEILVGTDHVFTFTADPSAPHGAVVHSTALSDLQPAAPGAPINPIGLSFSPDRIEAASDGTFLIFSSALRSIFRWDPVTQKYGQTIPLVGVPDFAAYSSVNNTVYLAYHSGLIRKIDLNADSPAEVPFASLPQQPIGLATAGEFVFAADPSGAWGSHYTFSPAGTMISAVEWNYYSTEYIWNPANRRMYFFRDDTSPNDLLYEEISATGVIGTRSDSPLHSSDGFQHPIRVSPDGNTVILGSGVVHDAETLQRLTTSLANSVTDVAWLSDRVMTIRQIAGVVQVQSLSPSTFALEKTIQFPGTPVALIALPSDQILSVTRNAAGVPEYRVLDSSLAQVTSLIGFSVQETDSSTTVSEGGTVDSFAIVLNSQPSSNVVINVSTSASDEIQVLTTAVTFTPQNWNLPQVVTVTGVDDNAADLDQFAIVSLSVDSALSDSVFAGVATQSVVTTTLDNEGAFGGILPAVRVDKIAYLVHRSSSQIERFDIETGDWLAPVIPVGGLGHPTAVLVNEFGIYLAFGKAVFRYSLDGTQRTHIVNAEYEVRTIHSDGNLLFLNQSTGLYARFISVSASTNTIIDTFENYVDAVVGSAIVPRLNRIFGRSEGISPADVTYVDYDDSGHFKSGGDSQYHGSFPGASKVWISPKGDRVIDNAGIVYSTDNLRYVSSLGENPTDIDFIGTDVPVILQGNVLTALSQAYLPTGSATLDRTPSEIVVGSDSVFAFSVDTSKLQGVHVQRVPLTALKPATPGEPIDPTGLAFNPDAIDVASNGTILMFSSALSSIFRWDPQSRRYLDTIPLLGSPDFEAYSAVTNTIYLAYHSGLIQKIDLNSAEPVEVPFARLPQQPIGLATAGEFVFAADPSGAWASHYTFSPAGTMISAVEWNYYSTEYIWNPANRRMYFFRDDTSPNDLLYEEISATGVIGNRSDSPLHGSNGFQHPIRVSPDGKTVVLGGGAIHSGLSLDPIGQLNTAPLKDVSWSRNSTYTLSDSGTQSQIRKWVSTSTSQPVSVDTIASFSGTPRALKTLSLDEMLLVTMTGTGVPEFRIIANDLTLVENDLKIVPLAENTSLDGLPKFRWNQIPDAANYQVQIINSDGKAIDVSGISGDSYSHTNRLSNGQYRTRVRAKFSNGGNSAWSVAYSFKVMANSLLSPTARSTNASPTVTWTGRDDAVSFDVWINNLDSSTVFHTVTGIKKNSYPVPVSMPPGRYAVWVRSLNASGVASIWSERRTFDVNALPVETTSGHGNTSDSTPTFSWKAVSTAQKYEILIQNASRQSVWRQVGLSKTSATVDTPLAPGRYTVWLQASGYGRAMSDWGPGTQLLVQSSPTPTIVNSVIKWSPVAEASSYNIQVYQVHSGKLLLDVKGTTSTSNNFAEALTPGKYEVRSSSTYADGSTSDVRITTIELFHAPVAITSSSTPTIDKTPVLTWTASAGASSYEIIISRTNNSQIYHKVGVIGTSHRVEVPLPSEVVRIWVRSHFANGSRSQWSVTFFLTIGPAPVVTKKEATLKWLSVKDATNYELWIDHIDSNNRLQSRYIFQDRLVDTSFTLPTLPKGRYSVWLRAVRAEAGQLYLGTWSSKLEFTVTDVTKEKRAADALQNQLQLAVLKDEIQTVLSKSSELQTGNLGSTANDESFTKTTQTVGFENSEIRLAQRSSKHVAVPERSVFWDACVDSVMEDLLAMELTERSIPWRG